MNNGRQQSKMGESVGPRADNPIGVKHSGGVAEQRSTIETEKRDPLRVG